MMNLWIGLVCLLFIITATKSEQQQQQQETPLDEQEINEQIEPIYNEDVNNDDSIQHHNKRTIGFKQPGIVKHLGVNALGQKFVYGYGPVDYKFVPVIRPLVLKPVLRPSNVIKPVRIRPFNFLPIKAVHKPIINNGGWKPVLPANVPIPFQQPAKPWHGGYDYRKPSISLLPPVAGSGHHDVHVKPALPEVRPVVHVDVKPVEPTVQPVVPVQPFHPDIHIHPAEPAHPVDPLQSIYPVHPVHPVHPLHPVHGAPVAPVQPLHPIFPAHLHPSIYPHLLPESPFVHRPDLPVLPLGAAFQPELLNTNAVVQHPVFPPQPIFPHQPVFPPQPVLTPQHVYPPQPLVPPQPVLPPPPALPPQAILPHHHVLSSQPIFPPPHPALIPSPHFIPHAHPIVPEHLHPVAPDPHPGPHFVNNPPHVAHGHFSPVSQPQFIPPSHPQSHLPEHPHSVVPEPSNAFIPGASHAIIPTTHFHPVQDSGYPQPQPNPHFHDPQPHHLNPQPHHLNPQPHHLNPQPLNPPFVPSPTGPDLEFPKASGVEFHGKTAHLIPLSKPNFDGPLPNPNFPQDNHPVIQVHGESHPVEKPFNYHVHQNQNVPQGHFIPGIQQIPANNLNPDVNLHNFQSNNQQEQQQSGIVIQPGQTDVQLPFHLPQHPVFTQQNSILTDANDALSHASNNGNEASFNGYVK